MKQSRTWLLPKQSACLKPTSFFLLQELPSKVSTIIQQHHQLKIEASNHVQYFMWNHRNIIQLFICANEICTFAFALNTSWIFSIISLIKSALQMIYSGVLWRKKMIETYRTHRFFFRSFIQNDEWNTVPIYVITIPLT